MTSASLPCPVLQVKLSKLLVLGQIQGSQVSFSVPNYVDLRGQSNLDVRIKGKTEASKHYHQYFALLTINETCFYVANQSRLNASKTPPNDLLTLAIKN